METETYIRKPFTAEAVRVTRENVNEIAKWCGGEVRIWKGRKGVEKPYVKVNVKHPLGVRQTEGRLGDWVLYANDGFKVYTDKAFRRTYEPVFQDIDLKRNAVATAMAPEIAEIVSDLNNAVATEDLRGL